MPAIATGRLELNSRDVTFVTACDANYFALCTDLIASLKRALGEVPRMRILDVGLRPGQAAELGKQVEAVVEPGWDMGRHESYPPWFRALTARPHLPKYAPDTQLIVYIDSDAWVQTWGPLGGLIDAAGSGKLAIVEEEFGPGFSVPVQTPGGTVLDRYSADSIKANVRRCCEQCFGPEITAAYGHLPPFNAGVFALRADSPSWSAWRDVLARALHGGFHFLVEQQSLAIAIRQGLIPVAPQGPAANYVCVHGLPWLDPASRRFTLPKKKHSPIGVLHLTDAKKYPRLPIPTFPRGDICQTSLLYRDFLADQKVGRNDPCPCGSGKRYKHCHGA
jgi:hypothetical protein